MSEADRIAAEYARRAAEVPASVYSPAAPSQLLLRQERELATLALLRAEGMLPLDGLRVIEVGCGSGQWLVDFETWGASRDRLAGIDLLEDRVERARARLAGADLRVGDASRLPWPDGSFDVVLQSTVFSSILDEGMRRAVAGEMARLLGPGGVVLWNDFIVNNPRNPAVRGIRRRDVRALFPSLQMRARRVTLVAPLARLLAPRAYGVAWLLQAARVFDTHLVATLRAASPNQSVARSPNARRSSSGGSA